MQYRLFIESQLFSKLIGRYLQDDEYAELQRFLINRPRAGPIIPRSGGVRKLRWRAQGTGKRGGIRLIYYLHEGHSFWMLTVYRKGEADAIPGHLLRKIKEAMTHGNA
mgnify:CR=1 FL=1